MVVAIFLFLFGGYNHVFGAQGANATPKHASARGQFVHQKQLILNLHNPSLSVTISIYADESESDTFESADEEDEEDEIKNFLHSGGRQTRSEINLADCGNFSGPGFFPQQFFRRNFAYYSTNRTIFFQVFRI